MTRERERGRKRGRRAVILNAPRLGKKETAESLVLSLFSSRTRALYKRTFTVLYVNKSSLKSAQRAPKPIAAKTKAKTKEERFIVLYGMRLLEIFVKTDRHQRKEQRCPGRGENLRLRLVKVSLD